MSLVSPVTHVISDFKNLLQFSISTLSHYVSKIYFRFRPVYGGYKKTLQIGLSWLPWRVTSSGDNALNYFTKIDLFIHKHAFPVQERHFDMMEVYKISKNRYKSINVSFTECLRKQGIYNHKKLHLSLGHKTPHMVFNNVA